MGLFGKLFGGKKQTAQVDAQQGASTVSAEDVHWQRVYDARAGLYEQHFGALPADILKIMDLSVVWPGGGLYVIPTKLTGPAYLYATFGLSNPDMPATLEWADAKFTSDEAEGAKSAGFEGSVRLKANPRPHTDRPGYGYELVLLARENVEWPLWLLQWAARAEVLKDADLLGSVEKYHGITVEQVTIGEGRAVNLLISKAQAPFPGELALPNGALTLLVATVITDEEMAWSMINGRTALLASLQQAGVGQMSVLDRVSVVRLEAVDCAQVGSLEQAQALAAKGQLAKLLLFPAEFGGEEVAMNIVYVPPAAARQRLAHVRTVQAWADEGAVDSVNVKLEYKDASFVPARIHMTASHSQSGEQRTLTLEVW